MTCVDDVVDISPILSRNSSSKKQNKLSHKIIPNLCAERLSFVFKADEFRNSQECDIYRLLMTQFKK